ncbi:prepilin-type N-terminal cleavage/methylation domain-containing protein [Rhodoferax aquaticus]|nr:prepilin-type N-terminal cleavage/methylation domain-containing protein [Rhodoferax aquaticus]
MNRPQQHGFTLVELIIFVVVVSLGMAGILLVIQTNVKASADPMERKQAMVLADAVMEEILQKSFARDPSAPVGTNRASFDNVDDYNGKTQADFTDLPAALAGYTLAIAVAPATLETGVSLKKVTVTVARGSASRITMVGYRANY